jgi:hypothetical protein
MDALKRGESPNRQMKAASQGIHPSGDRLNVLVNGEVMNTQKGLDNISKMVKF